MKLVCFGINHIKTPIEVREKFCLNVTEQEALLNRLKSFQSVKGAFVLSTCNRIEIYADVLDEYDYTEGFIHELFELKKVKRSEKIEEYFYYYENDKVASHLLSVSCGLDSLVIGEKQILGQIKAAIELARTNQLLNKPLNILTNLVVSTGKKVRRETNIGLGGTSVAWASVIKMERELGDLSTKAVLIIGAGKMGEITCKQLKGKNIKEVYITNRTKENAEQLAGKLGGVVIDFEKLEEALSRVDICVSSAAVPHYVLGLRVMQKVMEKREGKELHLMDISVPRSIDPSIGLIEGVHAYTVDDLKEITESNMQKRYNSVPLVEAIIVRKTDEYYAKISETKHNKFIGQ